MFADRVFEKTSTTGTGSYVMLGASPPYRGFSDVGELDGKPVCYHAINEDNTTWESGWGVFDANTVTLTRNLLESSTGGLINWGTGDKSIYIAPSSSVLRSLTAGNKGTTRPGWLPAGATWTNDNVSPWVVYLYDGADDIPVGEIDAPANTFRAYAGSEKAGDRLGASVASAATANIWSSGERAVHVTGTTTITSLGTAPQAGAIRRVVFDDALTLTNGANLILPGGANIATAAGDSMVVLAETTTDHRVVSYTKADGKAVVAASTEGVAKAWVAFNGMSAVAIDDSFNVLSVTDNGPGDWTVNWDTDFGSADYCAVVTGGRSGSGNNSGGDMTIAQGGKAAGSLQIQSWRNVTGAAESPNDVPDIAVIALGDQ